MKHETCAEINLNNLAYNIHAIQQRVSPSQVIPVVKADAYSQGAVPVTKRLVKEGFNFFSVARFQEAMELRKSEVTQSIWNKYLKIPISTIINLSLRRRQ